jgi:hypothetical protein
VPPGRPILITPGENPDSASGNPVRAKIRWITYLAHMHAVPDFCRRYGEDRQFTVPDPSDGPCITLTVVRGPLCGGVKRLYAQRKVVIRQDRTP